MKRKTNPSQWSIEISMISIFMTDQFHLDPALPSMLYACCIPLLMSSLTSKCMYPSKSTLLVCNTGFSVTSLIMTLMKSRWRHQRSLKTLWNCFTCSSFEKLWTAPLKWQHSGASQLCRAEHTVLPVNIHLHTSVTLYIYTTRGRHHHSLTAQRCLCESLSTKHSLCIQATAHSHLTDYILDLEGNMWTSWLDFWACTILSSLAVMLCEVEVK